MILARSRNDHGTPISREDFTVKSSMYHATVFIKYETNGPPEEHSGTALLYLYDKYYAYECVSPPGTGFDQSTRGLAALYYVMLPAAGQVMCWHLKLPLSEAAARGATEWRAGVAK